MSVLLDRVGYEDSPYLRLIRRLVKREDLEIGNIRFVAS
jgi:hypothetical protein